MKIAHLSSVRWGLCAPRTHTALLSTETAPGPVPAAHVPPAPGLGRLSPGGREREGFPRGGDGP